MEVERVVVRPVEEEDVEKIVSLWTNPQVTEHLGGPKDPGVIREFAHQLATDPHAVLDEEGDRWWSVCLANTGAWLGNVALLAKEVEGRDEIELCYFFLPEAWGHGYATEAAKTLAGHAFDVLDVNSLIALIEPGNGPSIGVAERIGMRLERTIIRPGGAARDLYRLGTAG